MTRRQALAYHDVQVVLSALLLAVTVPSGEWPLRIPFGYRGDGVIQDDL